MSTFYLVMPYNNGKNYNIDLHLCQNYKFLLERSANFVPDIKE